MLQVQHITQFFNNRLVLKDISAAFSAGSITLLAGPNGAGKSTLLRLMTGLLHPTAGKVALCKDLQQDKSRIGFLGHQNFLYPELTAFENLQFWSRWHAKPCTKKVLESALSEVELAPFAHERVQGFSRGMAQRLSLARVFLQLPLLLLLDEPACGLDIRSATLLRQRISTAGQSGTCVIWISHDLPADMPFAHNIVYIMNKKIFFPEQWKSVKTGTLNYVKPKHHAAALQKASPYLHVQEQAPDARLHNPCRKRLQTGARPRFRPYPGSFVGFFAYFPL